MSGDRGDPLVQLGTLEALLTGRDYGQIVAGQWAGTVLTERHGGQRLVVAMTDELQRPLARADDAELAAAAVPWGDRGVLRQADPQQSGRLVNHPSARGSRPLATRLQTAWRARAAVWRRRVDAGDLGPGGPEPGPP